MRAIFKAISFLHHLVSLIEWLTSAPWEQWLPLLGLLPVTG